MKRNNTVFLAGLLLAGCSSTPLVLDRIQWCGFSTEYPGGVVSWHAPRSTADTGFEYHARQVTSNDINSAKVYALLWHQGYDLTSWGYATFIMQIDVQKYSSHSNVVPTLESFRKDQMHLWSGTSHTIDVVSLGGRTWLRINTDYNDKLNACRRIQFQTPLSVEYYLNVMAEYDNEARRDPKWLESRMTVMSNVIESIRLTSAK